MDNIVSILQAGAGVLLVFLVPGVPWAYALLGTRRLSVMGTLGIGAGLSIALVPTSLFLLNVLLGIPVNLWTVLAVVAILTSAGALAAMRRNRDEDRVIGSATPGSGDGSGPTRRIARGSGALALVVLALIMGFAAYTTTIPKSDNSYPVHQDEWTHLAEARTIVTTGDIPMEDPVTGEARSSPYPEAGYHLFLAETKLLTGLPWPTIFQILPSVIFALTVLGAYIFGKARGFGLEAALFASLLPTTVRFLGPAFAVPLALGLLFVPLVLYLVSDLWASRRLPVTLAILLSFLYITHPPTALFVSLIVATHGVAQTLRRATGRRTMRRRAWIHLTTVLGAVALSSLPLLILNHGFVSTAIDEPPLPDAVLMVPGGMIQRLGYVTYVLFVAGLALLALGRRRSDRALLLVTVLVATAVFLYHAFRIGPEIMYSRGIIYLSVLMLLIAGFAAGRMRRWLGEALRPAWPKAAPAVAAAMIAAGVLLPSLWLSVESRYEEDYRQVVDEGEYQDFVWIREHLCLDGSTLVDPVLGRPFAAVTGKQPYAALHLSVSPVIWPDVEEARDELWDGVADAGWLRERGVSAVYSKKRIESPELVEVHDDVYVLSPASLCER